MTVGGPDFRSIREWRGSQDQAFEELCYQLRDPTPEGAVLVKTGSPDGGLEWYVTLDDEVQWGWQVKFIFDINSLLGSMESSLSTVVERRPACRRLTFCIPFDLPDSPGAGEWKSARQKFEARKQSWRERIPGAAQVRVELWSGGDLLERLVRDPAQRGIVRFFWDQEVFSPEWCKKRQKVTVKAADRRYSPEFHVELPVTFALEGLALSEAYWGKFQALRGAVVRVAERVEVSRYTGIGVTAQLRSLVEALAGWDSGVPRRLELPERLDQDRLHRLLELTGACQKTAHSASPDDPPCREQGEATSNQKRSDQLRGDLQHELRLLGYALRDFEGLLQGRATEAAGCGALLLTGEAGQGKTHLFCDVGQRAVDAGRPAVVLLAGELSGRNVWSEIAGQLGLGRGVGSEELLGAMQAAAEASGAPFLLLVDALNEATDPASWREQLPGLLAEVAGNPWISLGVSVRSSYLPVVLPADGLPGVAEVGHPGFAGRELEATERFFDAFGLEQPRVPMLTPEFTNPLFLKLYCDGLQELGLTAPPAGGDHISDVFELYLQSRAERITQRLELDPGAGLVEAAVDAFSEALAAGNRERLTREHSRQLIDGFAPERHQWPETLFGQLLSEGVLATDAAWDADTDSAVEVVRFTYQRLSDYMAAARLLEPLDGDPARLSEALANDEPLRGRVLEARAGWVEALAVQIPERFGVELLDAADWRLDPGKRRLWEKAFVESIAARRPSTVTKQTRKLLFEVQRRSPGMRRLGLETILSVAASPEHPLNANWLHSMLMGWSMPERDVAWSIPTYYALGGEGAFDRLARWAARGPHPDCPDEVVELAALPLVWAFTSPNRRLRDYATKALSGLLAGSLPVLPSLIRRFEGVDDPYVVERLAVVSHGAVLRGGSTAPEAAAAAAQELRRVALAEDQVPNIVTRDAVRGVHEWCARHHLIDDQTYTGVRPPYGSSPPGKPRTEKQLEREYMKANSSSEDASRSYGSLFFSIFGWGDFSRYVIEPSLKHFSQHQLSSPASPRNGRKETYPAELGKRWVFERVLTLGWTPGRFGAFDRLRTRSQSGRGEHKPERFGKKYQWIALRELLARVSDNFRVADRYIDSPETYTGPWQLYSRDIDPTLPAPPRERNEHAEFELGTTFPADGETWWVPEGPCYRRDDPPPSRGWAAETGDIPRFEQLVQRRDRNGASWVVLHAYYNWDDKAPEHEERQSRRRRLLWSHIYSWLVKPDDLDALVAYLGRRSLMNRWMPTVRDHSGGAYLGELPWAAAQEHPNSWQNVRHPDDSEPTGLEAYPTWTNYGWGGNELDCSIENDGVGAGLPAPVLFETGELSWLPGTRQWALPDGITVAQYRERLDHSALLVREDWLQQALRRTGHPIVFGWLGEKQLLKTGLSPTVSEWTEINAVASLAEAKWAFGERRFEHHPASE